MKSKFPHNKWAVAIILSMCLAMDYQARVAINSVFPMLKRDLAMSNLQIGLTASLFLWTYALLSPLAGFLGDRFSRRSVLVGSAVLWNLITILSGFAASPWQLVLMRVILAASQVCFMPTAMALITDEHGKESQGKAIGIFQSGSYVGVLLAGLPTAFVATHMGWRAMLWLSGGVGLCCAVLMLALPKEERNEATTGSVETPAARTSVKDAIRLFRKPTILTIMLAISLFGGASWVLVTYLPLFMYERYHLSLELAAFQATFYMRITAIFADPLLGHIADKWSTNNARHRFHFCALAGFAGLPALAAVGMGAHNVTLLLGLVAFGVVSAAADVSWMPMLALVTSKYQRATAFGYLNMAGCLAGGACAMVTAILMKSHPLGLVIASGGGLFFLLGAALIVLPRIFLQKDMISEDAKSGRPKLSTAQ